MLDKIHVTFQIDVEHKLQNITSLSIVSLGVLYKYILALVLSEKLWNRTKRNSQFFSIDIRLWIVLGVSEIKGD